MKQNKQVRIAVVAATHRMTGATHVAPVFARLRCSPGPLSPDVQTELEASAITQSYKYLPLIAYSGHRLATDAGVSAAVRDAAAWLNTED